MRKKFTKIALSILILIFLAVWSPWNSWNLNWLNFLGIKNQEKYCTLKVNSLAGEIDIYVDEEYIGTAIEDTGFFEVFTVTPGEHLIKLSRNGLEGEFIDIVRKINFVQGVDVIIGYEIGPSEEFSEGHILYAQKSFLKNNNPILNIITSPDGVKVDLDQVYIGDTPFNTIDIDINQKHKLTFSKEGYDVMEIEILPDKQEDRDKLKGMSLVLEINLFTRPITIVNQDI